MTTPGQSCVPPGLQQQGYAALCCARPATDVLIKTNVGPELRALRRKEAEAKYK